MDIVKRLITHQSVFENMGEAVPPFRITPKEHKELLKLNHIKRGDKNNSRIACFHGVDLELVMPIEDYCL